jgi:GTP-binding protein YchF
VPTTIEIVDIAGLVKGASKGEGLGNQFLANIRETDAIIHVLRCFEDDNIIHVDGNVNPLRDKDVIDTELQLRDLDSVEKKLQKVARAAKTGDKDAAKSELVLNRFRNHLEQGLNARTLAVEPDELVHVEDLCLLTLKPVMYVCNVDEAAVVKGNAYVEKVKEAVKNENAQVLVISAAIEADIAQLDSFEDREAFLNDLGLSESGVAKLINAAYSLLNLITYFTAGVQEVRAWTINRGWKAPQAAGVIHTDFERGFIKAEVIHYADYVQYGSESACKEVGKLSIEGKEYIVHDGDVMHFKFNV